MSKVLTVVPPTVRTFSDLGFFAFGPLGQRLVVASEAGVCFLSPIAFLILGGTVLLPRLLDGVAFSETEWIVIMALGIIPALLVPTLKASGHLCIIGGIAAVVTDSTCIYYSFSNLEFAPRETQIQLDHSIQTFGTIMFALGAAIIIPPIQRQHTQPWRLANLVSITLLFITSLYLLIGVSTYYQYGCTAPTTLLDELPAGSATLKFATGCMLAHVIVAFPLMLQPTLFDVERYILGKDADFAILNQRLALEAAKRGDIDVESSGKPILGGTTLHHTHYRTHTLESSAASREDAFLYGRDTRGRGEIGSSDTPYVRSASPTADGKTATKASDGEEADHEFTFRDRMCSGIIRIITLGAQTTLAVLLQGSFIDVLSLIGATSVTFSCMVMPCLCYLRVYPIDTRTFLGRCDRTLCYIIIVASSILGAYCTYVATRNIVRDFKGFSFDTSSSSINGSGSGSEAIGDEYPFCHEGERN